MPTASLFAVESSETVSKQIEDTRSEIQKIEAQIKAYQAEITKTSSQSSTLTSLIKELTLTKSKLAAQVSATKKKISLTGNVISDLNDEISTRQNQITLTEDALKNSIKEMAEQDNASFIEILASSTHFSELSDEFNNKESINKKVRELKHTILTIKEELGTKKTTKEKEQASLTKLKQNLTNEQKAVELAKNEKDRLLKETKNKESNYKKLLAEQEKKRAAFEKELRDYEAQLKFILNNKLLPSAGSGVLSWPLENVFITQLFGVTSASKRLYRSGSHSGVDFRATIGTKVMAMAAGTVEGVGNTDDFCKGASFGKWIFIKYNNGLSSTYGHLSDISVRTGDKVKAGDVVGLSGNTGHSTGPHLHVTVYASQGASVQTLPSKSCNGKTFTMPIAPTNAYLDPMLYLPGTTSLMYKKDTHRD